MSTPTPIAGWPTLDELRDMENGFIPFPVNSRRAIDPAIWAVTTLPKLRDYIENLRMRRHFVIAEELAALLPPNPGERT